MLSRRFVLDLPGVSLAEVRERAEPHRRKHGPGDLWIRIAARRGSPRIAAQLRTDTIRTYGGAYVPNGTLRGRLEPLDAGGGLRVTGRVRWGFTTYLIALMLAVAVLIAVMAVGYGNTVIGWVTVVPLAVAAVFAWVLAGARRADPSLLRERLELVLTGRLAEHQRTTAAAVWQQLLPGRPLPDALLDDSGRDDSG